MPDRQIMTKETDTVASAYANRVRYSLKMAYPSLLAFRALTDEASEERFAINVSMLIPKC